MHRINLRSIMNKQFRKEPRQRPNKHQTNEIINNLINISEEDFTTVISYEDASKLKHMTYEDKLENDARE